MAADYNPKVDYYEILQVHPKAEDAVIRGAYRAIVRDLQVHPDLGGLHDQAVLVNEAYRVLSDAQLRCLYDSARQELLTTPVCSEQNPTKTPDLEQHVHCPACGKRNRISPMLNKNLAICGSCHQKLFPEPFRVHLSPEACNGDNILQLSSQLYQDLKAKGELELRFEKAPRGGKVACRRCRRIWVAPTRGAAPRACPHCNASDWNAFRLFKCRLCRLEFTTPSLHRHPYLLFPTCPGCAKQRWHPGLEAGLFSGLFRLLK